MVLANGVKNNTYYIGKVSLPLKTAKRLEVLGMTTGAQITVLNKKSSALIVTVRGTRFALGRTIAGGIEIRMETTPSREIE